MSKNLKLRALARLLLTVVLSLQSVTAQRSHQKRSPSAPGRAEWLATGGHAWDAVGGVVLRGTMTEDGAPGRFEKTIDLRKGSSKVTKVNGPMHSLTGFDRTGWLAENGIVISVDVPSQVETARTQAFVDRAGWRVQNGKIADRQPSDSGTIVVVFAPPGGNTLEVSFDRESHLVKQVVIETSVGPLTTTYSDWRAVSGVRFPFHQVQADSLGGVTTFVVEQVELLRKLPDGVLARPPRSQHGRLLAAGPLRVPFTYRGSHILVPAKVNGADANFIFDTGASNYFTTASAQRLGLQVSGGVSEAGVGESSTPGGFATVDNISLGGAELRDETVVVAPAPWGDSPSKQGPPIDGLLGFEFLAEFRTTIDYPAQTITFSDFSAPLPALDSTATIPFFSDGHIYVEAEVNQQRGLFIVDTGAGNTVTLFPDFAKRHHLDQNLGQGSVSHGGFGGKSSAVPVTLAHFKLARTEFHDLPAEVSQNTSGVFASRSLAGNIGGAILRCFRITFDYGARTVTFEPDSEHLRECPARK